MSRAEGGKTWSNITALQLGGHSNRASRRLEAEGAKRKETESRLWHQQRAMGVPSASPPPETSFEWISRHGNAFTRAQNPGERSQHWLEPRNKKRCFEADKRDNYQRDSFPARQHTSPILLVGKEWISAQLYLAPVSPASGCHSQAGPTDPMPGPLHLLALQLQAPGSPTQGLGPRSPRCRISDRNRSMPLGKIIKS